MPRLVTTPGWLLLALLVGAPGERARAQDPGSRSGQGDRFERLRSLVQLAGPTKPDGEDFSCVLPQLQGAEIIFAGESPHWVPDVRAAIVRFALQLAAEHDLRVMAFESLYGRHPFMEMSSLGLAGPEATTSGVPEAIVAYNQQVPEARRLLATAIDIEHSINHSKPATVKYLSHLASRSDSAVAAEELRSSARRLLELDKRQEIHDWLDELADVFARHRSGFAAADWQEVDFSLGLMHASVDYQLLWSRDVQFGGIWKWHQELRGRYFRETVKRALNKARARQGRLLCYVGGAHAVRTPLSDGGSIVGKYTEAHWFGEHFAQTRGHVASILFKVLSYRDKEYRKTGDLDDIAHELIGEADYLYVPLDALDQHAAELAWSRFFSKDGHKYDGVMFLANVSPQQRD